MSRYRSSSALSRRRALRPSEKGARERQLKRSIRVHDVNNESGYYIESGNRYSAAHRTSFQSPKSIAPSAELKRTILSWAARLARLLALIMCVVVIANTFLSGGARLAFLSITNWVSHLVPAIISGLYVFQSPFGGAFRGDIAIVAIILFVIDWVLCNISASLK